MTSPSSWSLAMIQDTLWGLVDRNPTDPFHISLSHMSNLALCAPSFTQALWQCLPFLTPSLVMPLKICIPSYWTLVSLSLMESMETIGVLVNQFIQLDLVHHQLALGSQN
ncbi:hypothetical protein DSO57_1001612 [Entomophthora muscae]|uniref:Uncharacterized protein n=1 Tax=Entomophthora muscae TaxID=34485 RepID=A0ACC2RZV1_9FUNG|nr:hypothetical protein DSO57_1001612 [Entomophthora muscae]